MATTEQMKINPKYKDRLFCLIFGDTEHRGNIISLYNALNGTEYDDSEDIKVTTIDDVIYINMKNDDLLEKCKPLAGYMKLINTIRENEANGMDIKQAIDKAVQFCINDKENVLRDFLRIHRSEVLSVCLTEFNQEVYTESVKEEGRAEGLKALIFTLKQIITDSEEIFQMVIKNDAYKNLTREDVFKYL